MPESTSLRLDVAVKAMDLRFVTCPILVGTYEQDPIAGPQALIDRELLAGALSQRRSLGLYAGPLGTVTVVLRKPALRKRGKPPSAARWSPGSAPTTARSARAT